MNKRAKPLPPPGFLNECFTYDARTGALTWRARPLAHFASDHAMNAWNARYSGKTAGKFAFGSNGQKDAIIVTVKFGTKKRQFRAHRLIFAMQGIKIPTGGELDHKDLNPFNNRMDNLRGATPRQNIHNRPSPRHGGATRALPKGVYLSKSGLRYRAMIFPLNRGLHLGYFDTPEEARAAYVAAAKRLHGDFARTE